MAGLSYESRSECTTRFLSGLARGATGGVAALFAKALELNYDAHEILRVLLQTTMVYTRVLNRGGRGRHSPRDGLQKAVSSDGQV